VPRPELERALSFIAANLERPLRVAEIARAARLSEFHLHRLFHATFGESIGRLITRRRLELAALRLAYESDRSITDIALSSGYSSSSNFSKAFSAFFGVSPAGVQRPLAALPASIGQLTERYGKGFDPRALYSVVPAEDALERAREAQRWNACVRYAESAGQSFACLQSPAGYDLAAVERTWVELIERARQLGLCAESVDAWGMAHDSPELTAPELLRYHAAVPCAEALALPAPLFRGRMAAGRYAVFLYRGAVSGVAEAYRGIYSCWFRESSLAPDDFVPIDHYISDFPRDGQVELEMWFRVRARRAG
jgi:AraC family transcriptional regulator